MEACLFNSSMYVLVNGSTTKNFMVEIGLRQGGPLSPFLFVIFMEGLIGLIFVEATFMALMLVIEV